MYKLPIDGKKRISCKRCQDRKIKCSRTSPCQRCSAAGVRCDFRGDGLKRAPISREYVSALENKIEALAGFLAELKAAPSYEQEAMINAIDFGGHLSPAGASSNTGSLAHNIPNEAYLDRSSIHHRDETTIYHGPSSLCSSILLQSTSGSRSVRLTPPLSPICINLSDDFHGLVLAECIALFFRWQYPHCMFIERDEFLLDYLNNSSSGRYSSPALVYSICALGALMSADVKVRGLADGFSMSAIRSLESEGLLNCQETLIQALLLCSVYQIGSGNFSKASIFSGMGLRMSENLRDLNDSHRHFNKHTSTPRDIEFRRRMFKNCYEFDKMNSIVLGRPAVISGKTLTVGYTDSENSSSIWHDWLKENGLSHLRNTETSFDMSAVSERQTELCDIINDLLLQTHSSSSPTSQRTSQRWTEVIVNEFNARLWRWENTLPGDLRWNRWGSSFDVVHPSIATLHMLYHAAQISLHLPFLTVGDSTEVLSPITPAKLVTDATKICATSVDSVLSILRRFKSQYTLKTAPFVFVQGVIIATEASLATTQFQHGGKLLVTDANFRALDEALLEMSYSWPIATDSRISLQNFLTERQSTKQVAISSHSPASKERLSPVLSEVRSYYPYTPPSEWSRYGMEFLEPDISNMFSFGALDVANSYVWNPDHLTGDLSESRQSDEGISLGNEDVNFGSGLVGSSINYL